MNVAFKLECEKLGITPKQGEQLLEFGWRTYPGTAMHQGSARSLKWKGFLSQGGTQLTEQGKAARDRLDEVKNA